MAVQANQIVRVNLSSELVRSSVDVAKKIVDSIVDRGDLHERDYLERFIDCVMGELAEQMVIVWLNSQGKYSVSAVDKSSAIPDLGHDVWLKDKRGKQIRASVKSSISTLKNNAADILNTFTLATNPRELRDVNIQVYFWLDSYSKPRVSVPTLQNAAIFAWASADDLNASSFVAYKGEKRLAPSKKLAELRPMTELLNFII